jgi:hypothetical protein
MLKGCIEVRWCLEQRFYDATTKTVRRPFVDGETLLHHVDLCMVTSCKQVHSREAGFVDIGAIALHGLAWKK